MREKIMVALAATRLIAVKASASPAFVKITQGTIVTRVGSSRGGSWADYDNDGWIDLYVANSAADLNTNGKDFLFHNNGDGTFTEMRDDNDGYLDLFVCHSSLLSDNFPATVRNSLYRN